MLLKKLRQILLHALFIEKAFRLYIKENVVDENNISDPQQLSDS